MGVGREKRKVERMMAMMREVREGSRTVMKARFSSVIFVEGNGQNVMVVEIESCGMEAVVRAEMTRMVVSYCGGLSGTHCGIETGWGATPARCASPHAPGSAARSPRTRASANRLHR